MDDTPATSTEQPDPNSAAPVIPPVESPDAVEAIRKINEGPNPSFGLNLALGMPGNPIHNKVNESHITQALETAKLETQQTFILKQAKQKSDGWQALADRGFELLVIILAAGIFVFVVVEFKNQPDILKPSLTGIGGLFTGLLGGFGYGKTKGASRKDE